MENEEEKGEIGIPPNLNILDLEDLTNQKPNIEEKAKTFFDDIKSSSLYHIRFHKRVSSIYE
ncbi:hypothetical protein J4E06_09825 [Muricauda sp. NFXS6]|uniref:hypothetical protein n=1 Tax=Allomuricauda sp. NFXS6 TaxID=2819094 RepID=UPI0032DFD19E